LNFFKTKVWFLFDGIFLIIFSAFFKFNSSKSNSGRALNNQKQKYINTKKTILYNKSEILIQCISSLRDYFSIDNMTFNQTINLSEIELLLANIEGVSSVPMLKITNKCGGNYAPHSYNIDAATKDKIVYPSLDPSVFEIKFPDSDIKGRVR
jgi:hypothetical protein